MGRDAPGFDAVDVEDGFDLDYDEFKLPAPAQGQSPLPSTRSRSSSSSSWSCSSGSLILTDHAVADRRPCALSRRRLGERAAAQALPRAAGGGALSLPSSSSSWHPSSPNLLARATVAVEWHRSMHKKTGSFCRAALIRANACRFADRYEVGPRDALVGEGAFGRVHRCHDQMADMSRAVKRIRLPTEGSRQEDLVNEVDALIALDHPAIVRLIEYFVEGGELLLVMELLSGPSLGDKMRELGAFKEDFAVRCLKHMLKALFCCHCRGLAHNDVSPENFRFQTSRLDATLKMVDFGLSKRSCQTPGEDRELDIQHRDIWNLGTIFYAMLTGQDLFPQGSAEDRVHSATDESFIPSRLRRLRSARRGRPAPSKETLGLLRAMLEPSGERRVSAKEALGHPRITRSYDEPVAAAAAASSEVSATSSSCGPSASTSGSEDGMSRSCSSASRVVGMGLNTAKGRREVFEKAILSMRAFARAPRLKRVSLCVVAHLLDDSKVEDVSWLFRFLARDGWRISAARFEQALTESGVGVPQDFRQLFECADVSGTGALSYVEFSATAIACDPEVFCQGPVLRAAYQFLDTAGSGVVDAHAVIALEPARSVEDCAEMLREACGEEAMTFQDFERMMTPAGWCSGTRARTTASKTPPLPPSASGLDALVRSVSRDEQFSAASPHGPNAEGLAERNVVKSEPSEAFAIRQHPGLHRSTLRPYYEAQPVSNVVLGLIQGTSTYARQAVAQGCAEVVSEGDNGAFFFMPNPKYHWSPEDVFNNPEQRMRLVVWWIHPAFTNELLAWTSTMGACSPAAQLGEPAGGDAETAGEGVGDPGDFGYSEVRKPAGYLHSCRDLVGAGHIRLLDSLVQNLRRFLGRLLGDAFQGAHLSAGFHYPVRPQYSTLHLQCRVNSGDVCPGEGRGVDLFRLLQRLREDQDVFARDDETLFYEATANLRNALIDASMSSGACVKEVGPKSLILGSSLSP